MSEIISLELPSILIPSPYVANNHQYKNALDLVNVGASEMIEEKDLKGDILVRKIDEILYDDKKINSMKKNLKSTKRHWPLTTTETGNLPENSLSCRTLKFQKSSLSAWD